MIPRPQSRTLIAILALTACLHVVGMIRTPLPSQDGLKFIRIAREFGQQPWADVVRNADQHPLYPALIAALHPVLAPRIADGPDSWRVAAQGGSMLAMLAAIPLFFALARRCVGRRSALLATFFLPILPLFAELGHETLSDATALLFAVAALAFGTLALTTGRARAALGCGLCAGLGYLARPEVAAVPLALLAAGAVSWIATLRRHSRTASDRRIPIPHLNQKRNTSLAVELTAVGRLTAAAPSQPSPPVGERVAEGRVRGPSAGSPRLTIRTQTPHPGPLPARGERGPIHPSPPPGEKGAAGRVRGSAADALVDRLPKIPSPLRCLAGLLIPFLLLIASYAAIKGTISEKLSFRVATGLGDGTGVSRDVPLWVPPGLDDPRWDFAPKEESNAPGPLGLVPASVLVLRRTTEAAAWVLIPLACWGAWHHRGSRRSLPARRTLGLLALGFVAILVRHAMTTGYLSDRHCALLVIALLPWSAFGLLDLSRRWAGRRALAPARRQRIARLALASLLVGVVALQLKPGHASRWGYQQAGRWLAERAGPGDAVLDTRGWAAFVSDLRSYGPWHIRQALTDEKLAYIVISDDELTAESRRAETLAALLDYAAVPVAAFPERQGGDAVGVRVYRYARPESWEGIVR
ncbi:glycosyltransferase family 39 protein [Tautonia sp. JC769]|uniref:glycosyltransferase family 39 protein n=1 Tax=Tautonia sp. JC769 TaxID=3232135 RepID=UPI00345911CB